MHEVIIATIVAPLMALALAGWNTIDGLGRSETQQPGKSVTRKLESSEPIADADHQHWPERQTVKFLLHLRLLGVDVSLRIAARGGELVSNALARLDLRAEFREMNACVEGERPALHVR